MCCTMDNACASLWCEKLVNTDTVGLTRSVHERARNVHALNCDKVSLPCSFYLKEDSHCPSFHWSHSVIGFLDNLDIFSALWSPN